MEFKIGQLEGGLIEEITPEGDQYKMEEREQLEGRQIEEITPDNIDEDDRNDMGEG